MRKVIGPVNTQSKMQMVIPANPALWLLLEDPVLLYNAAMINTSINVGRDSIMTAVISSLTAREVKSNRCLTSRSFGVNARAAVLRIAEATVIWMRTEDGESASARTATTSGIKKKTPSPVDRT